MSKSTLPEDVHLGIRLTRAQRDALPAIARASGYETPSQLVRALADGRIAVRKA